MYVQTDLFHVNAEFVLLVYLICRPEIFHTAHKSAKGGGVEEERVVFVSTLDKLVQHSSAWKVLVPCLI